MKSEVSSVLWWGFGSCFRSGLIGLGTILTRLCYDCLCFVEEKLSACHGKEDEARVLIIRTNNAIDSWVSKRPRSRHSRYV